MAQRAHAKVTETAGGRAVFVAKLIEDAAESAGQ
jgi:hypothetical protein